MCHRRCADVMGPSRWPCSRIAPGFEDRGGPSNFPETATSGHFALTAVNKFAVSTFALFYCQEP